MEANNNSRQLPLHHITIRVPWHDNEWNGSICNKPCDNTSCLVLSRISEKRKDLLEEKLAGKSIDAIKETEYPPCVAEHGTFMSSFDIAVHKPHPYSELNPDTHGHIAPTPYNYRAFSAAAVPFRWMLKSQIEGDERNGIESLVEKLKLDWEPNREPKLGFGTAWVQEGQNQRLMLDTFFSALKPEESLVFFYAKATPLSEDPRRVIIGVGRVKSVGTITEYEYCSGMDIPLRGYLWERNVGHSIRKDFEDGFLFPYQELIELSNDDTSLDVEDYVAFAPDDFFGEYSYGSELLPHDGAIASLLECERAIQKFKGTLEGPWDSILSWIGKELNRLWNIRGPFPGFGSALKAFGVEHGTLLAWYIYSQLEAEKKTLKANPWDKFNTLLEHPSELPDYLKMELGTTLASKWKALSKERRNLLDLLSRCAISEEQATRYYQPTEREKAELELSDLDILENPYLIFERDRNRLNAVRFGSIDRGVFPEENIREAFPLPDPSNVYEAIDPRRVRALCVLILSEAIEVGHTLLPNDWLIDRVRNEPLQPSCPLDQDVLAILDDKLAPMLVKAEMADGKPALQLAEYDRTKQIISTSVRKRVRAKRIPGEHDWGSLVSSAIGEELPTREEERQLEEKARWEKAEALAEIFQSRISVLVGSAGTGKSTLLKALCAIQEVKDGGILLLAPTGKARVRLEQATGMPKSGRTIAQFLMSYKRYHGKTGRYIVDATADPCQSYKTVIIDECSMLTENQLAALINCLKNVARLVLVGDPQQLPPIGAGRPFVDIVRLVKPENMAGKFPEISGGYAGLTVPRRQVSEGAERRGDLLLADFFSGRPVDAGADEIWSKAAANQVNRLELIQWSTPEELDKKLVDSLVRELGLESDEDEAKFGASIGGQIWEKDGNVYFKNRWKDRAGAAESAENWQILSPLRGSQLGVDAINRLLQNKFRQRAKHMAAQQWRKIPKPMGPQGILWGDKVINVKNSSRRKVWPEVEDPYVANGDIGVVVGKYQKGKVPKHLEVELTAQTGKEFEDGSPQYKYFGYEFSDESSPPLELAYALTVHKTQGSEFGITFLVIPNPCRLLSREMLYTALTRHRNKVIIFHQGEFRDIHRFASDDCSEVARRLTNMFSNPAPIEIDASLQHRFLDANLIHKTRRGERVRSKSELIIADKLFGAGIDYLYEPKVSINGIERYPDFVIEDDDTGETWYWEHLGMLDIPEYQERWDKKFSDYIATGILPVEDGGGANGTLITTIEKAGVGLDSQAIDELVKRVSSSS